MNKEAKNLMKKTAKIAGVTCIALGGAALVASGAALKALTAGGKYLKDAVQKIINDEPKAEPEAEVIPEMPVASEDNYIAEDSAAEVKIPVAEENA